jgi:hypothetical protein
MRRLFISFAITAFAFSLSAQDLDKILNDHYKASSQDKLSNITTVSTKGKVVAMGMETPVQTWKAKD